MQENAHCCFDKPIPTKTFIFVTAKIKQTLCHGPAVKGGTVWRPIRLTNLGSLPPRR